MAAKVGGTYRVSHHHARLHTRRWAAIRRAVFERDGWRCVECGKAGRLECDHRVPLEQGGDPWDPDNLQTLCRDCHIAKTRREAAEAGRTIPGREAWRVLVEQIAKG